MFTISTRALRPLVALSVASPLLLFSTSAQANDAFQQCGKASWYKLGGTTASGERANPQGLTAAHRTLPFGTLVDVTNLSNGKTVTVRINDRGPFAKGRVIDVTLAAAKQLGFVQKGITKVRVTGADVPNSAIPKQKCQWDDTIIVFPILPDRSEFDDKIMLVIWKIMDFPPAQSIAVRLSMNNDQSH